MTNVIPMTTAKLTVDDDVMTVNLLNFALPIRVTPEGEGRYKVFVEIPQDLLCVPVDRQMATLIAVHDRFEELRTLNERTANVPGIPLPERCPISVGVQLLRVSDTNWNANLTISWPDAWGSVDKRVRSDVLGCICKLLEHDVHMLGKTALENASPG